MGKRAKKKISNTLSYHIREVATDYKVALFLNKEWCRLDAHPIIDGRGMIDFSIGRESGKLYDYLKTDPALIRGLVFKAIKNGTDEMLNFVLIVHFSSAQILPDKIVYTSVAFSGLSNLWVIEFQNDYPKELYGQAN